MVPGGIPVRQPIPVLAGAPAVRDTGPGKDETP